MVILYGCDTTIDVSDTLMCTTLTKSDVGFPLFITYPLFKVLLLCTTIVVLVLNPSFIVPLQIIIYRGTNGSSYMRLLSP